MLTLYHAPMSRSSRLVTLVEDLRAQDKVTIREVTITREGGAGAPDPSNPHPEKKVPALDHDGTVIVESIAIAQHLCELFPEAGLLPPTGTPERAKCLEWLAYYAGVIEPVVVAMYLKLDSPAYARTFRDWPAVVTRLTQALDKTPYLIGQTYTVADLIVHSLFNWMPDLVPDHAGIRDWHQRMQARPAAQHTMQRDQASMAAMTVE